MRIRLATSEDVPGIAAIYNHEILHGVATFDTVPWDDDAAHEWFGKHQDPRRPATVAIDDGGAVLGWGSLSEWSSRCAYARAAEDSFYVHPDHRGRGIGRAIMADLIGRAGAQGIAVLLARIETSCAASLRVHREFGFESIGTMRRVGEKFGRVLDVELMQRSLEDA
ncbi:MAG: N-acetyltransferase [Phycisphaeraceae bacterium]|nr:N-acetyltransferase [Phycisphaeraceae bacterium]